MYSGTSKVQEPPVTASAQWSHQLEAALLHYFPRAEGDCKAVSALCQFRELVSKMPLQLLWQVTSLS